MRKTGLLLLSLLVLAGCSGEPGEADMKNALESAIRSNPLGAALMGQGLEDFVKLGCEKFEQGPIKGYNCRYRATATIMGHKNTSEDHAIFVYGEKGWQAQM